MVKKVLVVDDSLTARKVVAECLVAHGYDVVEGEDGKQGLQMLEENKDVCLIFSDINMPWMTGLEMIEQIKKESAFSHIPICLLTTESSSDALTAAKKLGVDAFLVKPIQTQQLLAVLNGYVNDAG